MPLDSLDALHSVGVGVTHDASLRQRLEELESAVGRPGRGKFGEIVRWHEMFIKFSRFPTAMSHAKKCCHFLNWVWQRLDARSCFRADASEDSDAEAGIYERCVRGLPQFESDAEMSACPLCSDETHVGLIPRSKKNPGLPSHIQQEVDRRRQHTKLLREKIAMLEHESAMWEQKLHILGRRSAGTSPKNKIVQLFPKEKVGKLEQEPAEPPGSQGHAFAMLAYEPDIATLLETPSTAREVFEKMKHPRALQPLKPKPKVDMAQVPLERESGDLGLGQAKFAEKEAADDCLHADQRFRQARREELHRGLQNELQEMRLLEGERQKRREQKRAELQDELQEQLQQEKKAWQIRQEKQDLERKERQQRQEAAHKELILVELERLRDKISLGQKFHGQQVAQQVDEARLQELLQIKLDSLAEEMPVDGPKILTVKCFDWNEWLSSVQKFVELTPQALQELDVVFPEPRGNRTISLLEVDTACRGESMQLSEQVRAGLTQWMQTEGGRQACAGRRGLTGGLCRLWLLCVSRGILINAILKRDTLTNNTV